MRFTYTNNSDMKRGHSGVMMMMMMLVFLASVQMSGMLDDAYNGVQACGTNLV